MNLLAFQQMKEAVSTPEMTQLTVEYLAQQLRAFLRPQDKIMVCLPGDGENCIGNLLCRAARQIGAIPVELGKDLRWKTLLMTAFHSRAAAIAAPPLVVLGITKLAKATKTPLYFRDVVTAGYFCFDWMIDGIQRGLDCEPRGCYDPGMGAVLAGFSCTCSQGVHVRDDVFTFEIEDDDGNLIPEGELGNVVMGLKGDPSVRCHTDDRGRLIRTPCSCGQSAPRLVDLGPGEDLDKLLLELGAQMHTWSSILDCKVARGECGLELEIITFPGEKLPRIPSCARLVLRPWNPENDVPNWFQSSWRILAEKG